MLSAQFDRITGTRIATALTAKERELWHREDPNQRCTPTQRMADALAELICDESHDNTNDHQRQAEQAEQDEEAGHELVGVG